MKKLYTMGTNPNQMDENKIYTSQDLPEATTAGQAFIYDGEEWKAQEGYGYKKDCDFEVTWDGVTTGLTVSPFGMDQIA